MNNTNNSIIIKGARENNLKNIDLIIPKNKLVVFTGVSGSGKSSLAFNTIYEEGRRRYVDSLSAYARQFLGGTQKPLVDSIEGLSPAISIEQKTTHNNPRSTVGTITELYDYLRLLYARVGKPFCPRKHGEINSQTSKDILKDILKNDVGSKIIVLSPIVQMEKGTHQNLFERLRREGFLRVRVNGNIYSLDDEIKLEKNKKSNIDIVVDRITLEIDIKQRLIDAIEVALERGKGLITIENISLKKEKTYSKFYSCHECDFNMPLLEPRLFSFNSPNGMCEKCRGLGAMMAADIRKLIPNDKKTIRQGGIKFFENLIGTENLTWQEFQILLNHYDLSLEKPLKDFSSQEMDIILNGSSDPIDYSIKSRGGNTFSKQDFIEGIKAKIERQYLTSTSEQVRKYYKNTYMSDIKCLSCKGTRLNQHARSVLIGEKNIYEFTTLPIQESYDFIINLKLDNYQKEITELIMNEIKNRLVFLIDVGLNYLSLNRKAETLSGGESQRIRLATQIGSKLTGVLYVLDEPSIGLHQHDNAKLISSLKKMVDIGNTLIVVEHDEETIIEADWIVDIGPSAGDQGGEVVAVGTPDDIANNNKSITGKYLSGVESIEWNETIRSGNGKVLQVIGASENNLNKIDVKFPLGKFIAVTGVSGSGKSTLVNQILAKNLVKTLTNPFLQAGKCEKIKGLENVDKVVIISQSPIGKTPRSNPATYTSVFTDIRDLFASTQIAKARGYKPGRFSFNIAGGRCDKCSGDGLIKIEMHFLPNVYVECKQCEGSRYNLETLDVKYKNKTISDILNMRVSESVEFFENSKSIKHKLQTLIDVGLGYITLGQNATTLSGGESQRIKLALYLQKPGTGKTIYILDEPTTGLHQHDIKKLIMSMNKIVDQGDTVIVIEHNLDVIKNADYIIDLGPGGGKNGGRVVAKGTPEQIINSDNSLTGKYLKKLLSRKN